MQQVVTIKNRQDPCEASCLLKDSEQDSVENISRKGCKQGQRQIDYGFITLGVGIIQNSGLSKRI
jgi:hypothetical protein